MSLKAKKTARLRTEFGDFQTPVELAASVCSLLEKRRLKPASILEPTCGKGSFLISALEKFPSATNVLGLDINPKYIAELKTALQTRPPVAHVEVKNKDFFDVNWIKILNTLPDPILVLGNPPWVTNAALGAMGSTNLPEKSNFQKHAGLDAITGKSNFDISEWMLIRLIEWIQGRNATLAMLCKTAVARKVMAHAWKLNLPICRSDIYSIDAAQHFDAAVDACLLVCSTAPNAKTSYDCFVYDSLFDRKHASVFGYRDGRLVADVATYEISKHLVGDERYKWRSGIKHDCAAVMELQREGFSFRNGLGELVELEDEFLYPMLKSSEVANGQTPRPTRWMLVTQRSVGEDTSTICDTAPKTWHYLRKHAKIFGQRASSIYKNRPPFSIFGVGDYSFASWKVAISGFYKNFRFAVVGPYAGKPVMLDDTVYFIPCGSQEEAEYFGSLLNSDVANKFFKTFCFLDAKRPITTELLRRLDLLVLARELGSTKTLQKYLQHQLSHRRTCKKQRQTVGVVRQSQLLFEN